ncbi:MAG: hypothetical protein ACREQN_14235 [Candidatus Binataceae bacterium]
MAQSRTPHTIKVRVDSVLAADTHQGMDARLASTMGERLKALFDYTTYRLVRHQEQEAACGRMLSFTLPGGRILHVAPRSVDGNMITMELMLFQGPRPIMTTDLKLMDHGVLIVGGPRYQQGMLIATITATVVGGLKDQSGHLPESAAGRNQAQPAELPSDPAPR